MIFVYFFEIGLIVLKVIRIEFQILYNFGVE